jgi:hypothetical protein
MSAQDPKKCCKVLLTWEEEWFKYEKWFKSLAETPPPEQIPVPASDVERVGNYLKGEHVFRIGVNPDGIRNVKVRVDQFGTLSNPQEFNGKDTASVSGRRIIIYDTQTKFIQGSGTCKRLGVNNSGACNCQPPAPTGTIVKGSEKCQKLSPERKENERKSTSEVRPTYRFNSSITWQRGPDSQGGWTDEVRYLRNSPITDNQQPKVPVKRVDWWMYKERCTRKLTREQDCCL